MRLAAVAALSLLVSWVIIQVAADAAVPAPAGWNLIFSDDFNGAAGSGVNGTNWQYTTGTGYPGGPANFGTHEVETMTASTANVALDGAGNLKITPQRDGAGNWTSGRIETRRADFQPPAGGKLRVEGRIQMPDVTGAAAPRSASPFKPGGTQANYLQSYIDQVWNYYTANQWSEVHDGVTFTGRVVNGLLTGTKQDGSPFTVRKPTTTEVFECSGALALGDNQGGSVTIREVGRDFCAAFHRGVALNTAYWYDPAKYYLASPKDDYSAYFHTIGIDHRAYAFAYDDVNDRSSVQILSNSNPPTSLTLGIGW
ncbi:beta-1,3-glucanase family protein [Dactylosporangium sp. McL0621]|uniref:beta-1,3-glucanase family protein n=1 Tax=Dactylosporangium sp. McL0621 TaxID=3415678 RepID=UPI003CF3167E